MNIYVHTDVSSEHTFYLFLLEFSFDNQLIATIYRATVK